MRNRLCFCLLLLLSNNGYGFDASGNFWELGQATLLVGIDGSSPSGTSWNTAIKRAMSQWTDSTHFRFIAVDDFSDPCIGRANSGFGDSISSVNFTTDVCGTPFGSTTLAITKTSGPCVTSACTNFKITQSDILFKSGEKWDVFAGPLKSGAIDFERVALHELGHALGLRHETTKSAIMQDKVTNTHTLQLDDLNGAAAIYPGTASSFTTLPSVFNVGIKLPTKATLSGPANSANLSGSLSATDTKLDDKFLDIYQITFANNSTVNISLSSSTLDPFLYLTRITSAQEAMPAFTYTDNDSGGNSNAQIAQTIPAGTYWIGASSAGTAQQGNYTLNVTSVDSPAAIPLQSFQSIYGASVQINPNPSIAGSLSGSDFSLNGKHMDLYQISVTKQTLLRFDLSSSAFDSVLLLTRLLPGAEPQLQEIDESSLKLNDNFGSSGNSRIEHSLLPGTYWIGVTSAAVGQTGDYRIETSVVLP